MAFRSKVRGEPECGVRRRWEFSALEGVPGQESEDLDANR